METNLTPDFTIARLGGIYLLTPQTDAAFAWADQHIDARGQDIGQQGIPIEGSLLINTILEAGINAGFLFR